MPRKARIDAPGALRHIIIRGIERKAILKDNLDRANFMERLDRIIPETETDYNALVAKNQRLDKFKNEYWKGNLYQGSLKKQTC